MNSQPVRTIEGPELSSIFQLQPGYYPCWVDVSSNSFEVDRQVPAELISFLKVAVQFVKDQNLTAQCKVGCAYVRVMDAGKPENYMAWHVDNEAGGIRFATSISTDGARVNQAWPTDASLRDVRVDTTDWQSAFQPDNGTIAVFTTELHGVVPQPERLGEKTANFFVTFYLARQEADLYQTNNTAAAQHAALPDLEESRLR